MWTTYGSGTNQSGGCNNSSSYKQGSPTLFLWLTRYHLPDSFKLLHPLVQEDQETVGP